MTQEERKQKFEENPDEFFHISEIICGLIERDKSMFPTFETQNMMRLMTGKGILDAEIYAFFTHRKAMIMNQQAKEAKSNIIVPDVVPRDFK